MPENEIIHMVALRELLSKMIQRLLLPAESILFTAGQTIMARPAVPDTESHPRMKQAEKELQHTAMEDTAQHPVTGRHRPKAVAMAKTEPFPGNFHYGRLLETLHSKLLEVAVCPDIMITLEKEDIHATVNKILQRGKHPHIPFRHNIPVFIPEIPDVTEKVKRRSRIRKSAQKIDKTAFALIRTGLIKPKMIIRQENC